MLDFSENKNFWDFQARRRGDLGIFSHKASFRCFGELIEDFLKLIPSRNGGDNISRGHPSEENPEAQVRGRDGQNHDQF